MSRFLTHIATEKSPLSASRTIHYNRLKTLLAAAGAFLAKGGYFCLPFEPMNGLDKDGVGEMRKYLLDLKAQDKTILIASHSAKDINVLCESVVEMDKGRMEKVR